MMRGLLIFLAMSAFTIAMVPRDRRAVNTEEEEALLRSRTTSAVSTSTDKEEKMFCAHHTPCAWSIYKPGTKLLEMNITNTYCECHPSMVCQFVEDDSSVGAFIYRCRVPTKDDEGSMS